MKVIWITAIGFLAELVAIVNELRLPVFRPIEFHASRPNQLRVADFAYVATSAGVVHVAFVIDVVHRDLDHLATLRVQAFRNWSSCNYPFSGSSRAASSATCGTLCSPRATSRTSVVRWRQLT